MHFLDAATRGPAPDFRRTRRAAPGLCHAGATGMLLRWALAACCAVPAPAAFAQATQAAAAAAATPASQAAPAARSGPASPFAAARFSRVIGAGGVPLNVVELGDPALPGVLFIHGFRQSILSWSAQFGSDLSRRCHLVAFDLRGHGNSGSPWQPAAYDSAQPWGDDVAAVIAATGLKKPLVVGWSFGGNVAMDFASRHPELPVAGYLLTGTAGGTSAAAVPPPPPADAPPRPSGSPDLFLNIAAVQGANDMLFKRERIAPALQAQFAAAAMRVGPWVEQAVARRPRTDTAAPNAPLTFATGDQDPIIGAATVTRLKAMFPQARFVDFPGSGHAAFIEDAARFDALVDELQCGH